MSKIDISIKVNDYKIKTQGIKREHIISCIDNNDKKTKVTINTKELALTRENNELIIKIDFKNKNIRYYNRTDEQLEHFANWKPEYEVK